MASSSSAAVVLMTSSPPPTPPWMKMDYGEKMVGSDRAMRVAYVVFAFCFALFFGAIKAVIVGPVAGMLMILGNIGVIIGLFPAHVVWMCYTLFNNVANEYCKEISQLSQRLVRMMLLSLGLSETDQTDLVDLIEKDRDQAFNMNWYPVCSEPEKVMGLGKHTDSGLLAVVLSDISGLQVLRDEDHHAPARWVNVPSMPGSFVINVGDLGHILSNGRFKNVLHRAIVNKSQDRLSVVYLLNPPHNLILNPVTGGTSDLPVYRSITWEEYGCIKRKHFDNGVAYVKVTEEKEVNEENGEEEENGVFVAEGVECENS